ncbi:hypothetical protein Bbelb_238330 [Branchiostoma belcheri]|nr:hypothetical protein Bbelb_238330 [Branchiostoma belcheri]
MPPARGPIRNGYGEGEKGQNDQGMGKTTIAQRMEKVSARFATMKKEFVPLIFPQCTSTTLPPGRSHATIDSSDPHLKVFADVEGLKTTAGEGTTSIGLRAAAIFNNRAEGLSTESEHSREESEQTAQGTLSSTSADAITNCLLCNKVFGATGEGGNPPGKAHVTVTQDLILGYVLFLRRLGTGRRLSANEGQGLKTPCILEMRRFAAVSRPRRRNNGLAR